MKGRKNRKKISWVTHRSFSAGVYLESTGNPFLACPSITIMKREIHFAKKGKRTKKEHKDRRRRNGRREVTFDGLSDDSMAHSLLEVFSFMSWIQREREREKRVASFLSFPVSNEKKSSESTSNALLNLLHLARNVFFVFDIRSKLESLCNSTLQEAWLKTSVDWLQERKHKSSKQQQDK